MKPTIFTWGWRDYDRLPDPQMTRQHMAFLMRCWRRAKLNHCGRHVNRLRCIERSSGERIYEVINTPTGERSTFSIRSHA